MIKLLAFDVDGTVASHGGGVYDYALESLRTYQREGYRLAFISYKPAAYLSGFIRGLGLSNETIIAGENGADILFNLYYPVREHHQFDLAPFNSQQLVEDFFVLKNTIRDRFGRYLWEQPNRVTYSFYPLDSALVPEIEAYVEEFLASHPDFTYYLHRDNAFEILPSFLSKAYAIRKLKETLGLSSSEIITIGDGVNDLPMFAETKLSIGIGQPSSAVYVPSPEVAYEKLTKLLGLNHPNK